MWLLSRVGQEKYTAVACAVACVRVFEKALMSQAQATVRVICWGACMCWVCWGACMCWHSPVSLHATPLQDACAAQDDSAAVNPRARLR